MDREQPERDEQLGRASIGWYSWDSPVGLGLGFALGLTAVGAFLYFLHLASII